MVETVIANACKWLRAEGANRNRTLLAFLPLLDQMITDGLVTLERVRVIQYKAPQNEKSMLPD
jgi:hypothetical protein